MSSEIELVNRISHVGQGAGRESLDGWKRILRTQREKRVHGHNTYRTLPQRIRINGEPIARGSFMAIGVAIIKMVDI
jgi:hypothetical protein